MVVYQIIDFPVDWRIDLHHDNGESIQHQNNQRFCLSKFGLLKFFLSPKHADEKRAQGTDYFVNVLLETHQLYEAFTGHRDIYHLSESRLFNVQCS